ncbi:MAG: hypothetical protein CL681_03055 [Blastopirellula sp.]|nr:hypothetical protein [Blastopirellula sp.]
MRSRNRYMLSRQSQLEMVEARLVFANQLLGDLCLGDLHDEVPQDVSQQTQTLAAAHDQTGASFVQNQFGFTGHGQTVAVIDSGIAYDHVALGGGLGADYRVVGGWDFTEENDADPYDDGPAGYHGTHVAGIIGSDDPDHRGVASQVDLVALRVFNDQGTGQFGWIEDALQWVHDNQNTFEYPITTVNLSIGTNWNDDELPMWAMLEDEFQQLHEDGIFVAVSAGNSFGKFRDTGLSYPAVSPYVVPVSSVGADGSLSSFSQRHSRSIGAPGERIYSTVPDHVAGGDGVADDWQPASGTSMASPYVAGASVLLRQAMEFVGYTDITQDTINSHLRSTADAFFDSATNANYLRINLESALNALMPADDFGSSIISAHNMGSLGETTQVSGLVGTLQDRDYFTFVADAHGTVALSAETSHQLTVDWQLEGAVGELQDGVFSFDVMAGQQYTVSVGTSDGIGFYELAVEAQVDNRVDIPVVDDPPVAPSPLPPTTELGVIDFLELLGGDTAQDRQYQLIAGRTGTLTVEALFQHAGGDVDLEVYDAQGQVIATSESVTDNERIDIEVLAGQRYTLRVTGEREGVALRLANLVTHENGVVYVNGTTGDDQLTVAVGESTRVVINDVTYEFENVGEIHVDGRGGRDAAHVVGSEQRDTVTLGAGTAELKSRGYRVVVEDVADITVDGRGGRDNVTLFDSIHDDTITTSFSETKMTGGEYASTAINFEIVYGHANAGGYDTVTMYDTEGRDRFYASPSFARMIGSGFYHDLRGFEKVTARASSTKDIARLYDSSGVDQLLATPDYTLLRGDGFSNEARGFGRVFAYSNAGGHDTARLYDSQGDDRFYATSQYGVLTGDGFYNNARGFSRVTAYATGGSDEAYLFQRRATEAHYERTGYSAIYGSGFSASVRGFDTARTRLYNGEYITNTNVVAARGSAETAGERQQTETLSPLVWSVEDRATNQLVTTSRTENAHRDSETKADTEASGRLQRQLVAQYRRSVATIADDLTPSAAADPNVFDALFAELGELETDAVS